ncbi:MAG: hypothetical protein AAF546_15195 [Verrucomicrobiota bacterium]
MRKESHILGFGLDAKDGHKRLTQAERFSVVGGSDQTHECMTETLIKTFETLDRKGKELDKIERKELIEIIEDSRPD